MLHLAPLAGLLLAAAAPAPATGGAVLDDELARQGGPSVAIPGYVLDARRLRTAFLDLYGRPPVLAERETWAGRGLDELLDEALTDERFWGNWLEEELYYLLLIDNFRPSAERVLRLPADLAVGRLGVRDALTHVALSASFDRRNPGNDTFVTVVLEQFLGQNVQARPKDLTVGKKLYDGVEATFLGEKGRSQADVVRIALGQREALMRIVARAYDRFVRAEPDDRDLAGWARALEKDPLAFGGIVRSWMLSPAYDARLEHTRPLPNHTFVRALFVDLTDRPPTGDEVDRIRGAMDGLADATPLRSVFARLVVDSGAATLPEKAAIEDPTKWVRGTFERLLGRAASPDEAKLFVETFHDPACAPRTILLALVTHPDYATW